MVENGDSYTMVDVSRDATGEYKCSLIDNPTMEAFAEVVVKCKSKAVLPHEIKNIKRLAPNRGAIVTLILVFRLRGKAFGARKSRNVTPCHAASPVAELRLLC